MNKNNEEQIRNVTDINQVNSIAGQQIINNQTVATSHGPVGWIYEDQDGGLWFQRAPGGQWSLSIQFNLNDAFGIGLTPPNPQVPVYITKDGSVVGKHLQVVKCFRQGSALVPGAVG